jgi:hypothetical protein
MENDNKEASREEFEMFIIREFQDGIPIIDQILDKYGYGIRTLNELLIFFFSKFIEGSLVVLSSLIVFPLKALHDLPDVILFLISISFIIGGGIGSGIAGLV